MGRVGAPAAPAPAWRYAHDAQRGGGSVARAKARGGVTHEFLRARQFTAIWRSCVNTTRIVLVIGLVVATGGAPVVVSPLLAQATGVIRGRVLAAGTRQPLADVQVLVQGTALASATSPDGGYVIAGVAAGPVTVVAQRIGYQRVSRSGVVAAGGSLTQDFLLETVALSLDALVVTATGEARKREVGNVIASVSAADVQPAAVKNVSEMLSGRAAGVQVLQSSGTSGMGSRIRIRGSNSMSLSNEPIIFVDGVRASNDVSAMSFETGGDAPSRLNDLNPDEIANIEIVKGPAAATLYGTDAANGVIWITTKRGRAGATEWKLFTEQGTVRDVTAYPSSYRGVTGADAICRLADVAASRCTQASVQTLNPLESSTMSPFRSGTVNQYGLSASGGRDAMRFFLSSDLKRETGVLPGNSLQRATVRGNFDVALTSTFNAAVSIGYVSSNLALPLNGNYELGLIGNGLGSQGTASILGGWGFFPIEQLTSVDSRQVIDRLTGGIRLDWAPLSFWRNRLGVGLDQIGRDDDEFFPTGRAPAWLGYDQGARFANRFRGSTYTLDLLSSATFAPAPSLSAESSIGAQYIRENLTGRFATGRQLVAGSRSIRAAAVTEGSESTTENIKIGVFAQQQLTFRDRLFITGAVRADDASAFGNNYNLVAYPKLSLSWVMSEESFFPTIAALTSLRFRSAWGKSGLQPGAVDALRFFQPVPVALGGKNVTGVTFGNLGNPSLKPEQSTEFETGLDAQLFGGRVGAELTYYDKWTRDALVLRVLPPSLGVGNGRFENLGSVRNSGLEGLVSAKIIERGNLSWEVVFNGSLNSNELSSLGAGIPPINMGVQRHTVGYPLGGFWAKPITGYSDANGDGILAANEVSVGSAPAYLGSPFPKQQLSIRNAVSFLGWIRASALMEYRGGQKLYNNTQQWRSIQGITRALNDKSAPLADQAREVGAAFLGTNAGFIEDASFWKLREVSVTLSAPKLWASRLRTKEASITFAGRNLAVWTNYTGLDPEINQAGQSNFGATDFMTQPPVRYFTVRVNLSY